MNVIIFTGANLAAQAEASRLAMVQATATRLSAFFALGIDSMEQVRQFMAMRHTVYIWQIGDQASHPELSLMADHHITDAEIDGYAGQLPIAVCRALKAIVNTAAQAFAETSPTELQP